MQVCLFPAWVLQLDTGRLAEHSVQQRAVQTSSFCGPSSAYQAKTGQDLRPGSWHLGPKHMLLATKKYYLQNI